MKYNKIMESNESNKNSFLITCVCSIVLLLVMCYFGINSDSVLKGTAAASIKSCFDSTYILAEDDEYCCPKDKPKLSDNKLLCMTEDYYEKGYCTKDVTVDDETDVDDACNIFYDGILEDVTTDKETGKITVRCKATDAHDCGAVSSAYSIDETITDPSVKACYSCNSGFVWGSVMDYDGSGCELKTEYKTQGSCLVNNTGGYGCVVGISSIYSTTAYEWTNDGRVSGTSNYSYISDAKTEAQCLGNNKCYKSTAGTYHWGYIFNASANGYTLTSDATEETCLANVKTDPIIFISPDKLEIEKGKKGTISLDVNADKSSNGTFSITSGDTSIATVSDSSVKLTMGNKKTITVTGVAKGTTDITVKFTPDDSKYKEVTKKISVTVTNPSTSDGSSNYDPEPTKYTYTAIFKVGTGETLNGSSTLTCTSYVSNLCTLGSSFAIPTATKDGHTFAGWDTSTSCSAPLKSNLKMTSQNVTYNACFTANSTNNGNSGNNNDNNVDNEGNVTTNSPTGDIVIGVIWFIGIFAIAYFVVNYRRIKEN